MKYLNRDGRILLQNGKSTVRVVLMGEPVFSPKTHPGKVIKIFNVQEVIKTSPTNTRIAPGHLLALQFPKDKANAKEYVWPKGEEAQVPELKIQLSDERIPAMDRLNL